MSRTDCLTSEELSALHLGELPEPLLEELAGHLEACPQCEAAARALDDLSDPVLAAFRRSAQAGPVGNVSPPSRVGEYEILGEIGRGGMGVVYQARHNQLHRTVALKMLLGGAFTDRDERARFRAEAEAVARLHHPNIVQIYEIGEYDGDAGLPRPYFTLELVDGGNLAGRLAGRPQPPRPVAAWLESVARAVHYAHERGIVHRDLKPSNILLTGEGQPKICDFGVAKLLTGSDLKTMSGTLIGTAEYMAPEQALGKTGVGPAADIYALGAILYTALTGRPPFQGTSAFDTLDQVRSQEPVPPRRLSSQVPRDLDTICLKCLQKEPSKRYVSAQALADDLSRFLYDRPIEARRPSLAERLTRWVRHHKAAATALIAITVTLAAAAVISTVAALQKEAERAKAATAETAALEAKDLADAQRELAVRNLYTAKTTLTGMTLDTPGGLGQVADLLAEWRGLPADNDPRGWEWYYCQALAQHEQLTLRGHVADASAVAWSPDGRRLASGGFDNSIRIWDSATGRQLRSIPGPWGILAVSWHPDGKRLASANWSVQTISIWDTDTGKELRTFAKLPQKVYAVAYSPDGKRIASVDEGATLTVWDADSGKSLFSRTGQSPGGLAVCWSPDSRQVAASNVPSAVKICDAESGKETATLNGVGATICAVRWSPDGRRLAGISANNAIRIWNASTGTAIRTIPAPLAEDFPGELCWSPDSTRIAAGFHDLAVRIWEAESGILLRELRGHNGSRIAAVDWSPDGRHLASAERGWNGEIKIWDLNAAREPRLFALSAPGQPTCASACWSPDSRWLATAHSDGSVRIYDLRSERPVASIAAHEVPVASVSWSPAGDKLASLGADGSATIWNVTTRQPLTHLPRCGQKFSSLAWSPDGTRLLAESPSSHVALWDPATGVVRDLPFTAHGVAWDPHGDRIAAGGHYRIDIYDAASGERILSWETASDYDNQPYFSPDGSRIASIADFAVDVRDATSGRPVYPPLVQTQHIVALAWSSDGRQLATATIDHRLQIWDAVTGNPILGLRCQNAPVTWIGWSPDGLRLAALANDGSVQVWDATPGYQTERSASLLPTLEARLRTAPSDVEALRLRAGVYARRGQWEDAARDAVQLAQSASRDETAVFQAGWWITTSKIVGMSEDPFTFKSTQRANRPEDAPRWYQSADDPNGYVPLAKHDPYYVTRVFAPRPMKLRLELAGDGQAAADIYLNGSDEFYRNFPVSIPIGGSDGKRSVSLPITLVQGWNAIAVGIEPRDPTGNIHLHPRAGFFFRLRAEP
jgi:WD40 repeat protein/tRNA A-37 threonylcarbamoyl transferase component Bud32